jgi:hypothetical protein
MTKEAKQKSTGPPGTNRSGEHRIDLSSVHADEGVAREPWEGLLGCKEGLAELSVPGLVPLRRALPVVDLNKAVEAALLGWFGARALQHWSALRRLRTVNGRAVWKLDAHLAAIGEPSRDAQARQQAAAEVERLARLEMTVYTPGMDLRLQAPLLTPLATTQRKRGDTWVLDDMVLRFHPLFSETEAVAESFPPEASTERRPTPVLESPASPAPPEVDPLSDEPEITAVKPGAPS